LLNHGRSNQEKKKNKIQENKNKIEEETNVGTKHFLLQISTLLS
jgi:hypothetical protein